MLYNKYTEFEKYLIFMKLLPNSIFLILFKYTSYNRIHKNEK